MPNPGPPPTLPPNMALLQLTFDCITRQFQMYRGGRAETDVGDVYLMLGLAFETTIKQRLAQESSKQVVPAEGILVH